MFGIGSVNGLARPGRQEYLHGGMAVAAGAAIEGFSNVRVRFDFPARNGLTKFGVADFPGIVGFAADAEKVGELLVGQSEKAHPIRALDKLRLISTRTPNSARGVVGLALAELFLRGFGLRHARACRGGEFIDPRGDVLISRSNLVMRHRV